MWYRVISVLFILFLVESNCRTIGYYTEAGREYQGIGGSGDVGRTDFKTWLKLRADEDDGSGRENNDDISGDAAPAPVANCDEMLDITFVLDASESIGPVGFRMIKWYSKEILDKLNITDCDNVAVIKVTDFANSEMYLGTRDTKTEIFERIDALEEPHEFVETEVNKSRIALGLLVADELVFTTQLGSRKMSKKYVVLMTDGKQPRHDSSNRSLTLETLVKKLSKKGIHILVLAIGEDPSIEELVRLTPDEKNIFPEERYNDLINVLVPKDTHPNAFNEMATDFYVTDEPLSEDENNFNFAN